MKIGDMEYSEDDVIMLQKTIRELEEHNIKLKEERDFFKEQAKLWRNDYKNEYEENRKLKENSLLGQATMEEAYNRIIQLEQENIILKENIKIMKDIIVRLDKEVQEIKEKLGLDE